jgi:hypothetical protein
MKVLTESDVRKMLAAAVAKAGGARAFGRGCGVSHTHVGRVLAGEKLSPAILNALRLEVASTETLYRRKRK